VGAASPVRGRILSRTKQAKHTYASCRDKECQRPLCVAYKEGYSDGYEDGYAAGSDE
jgi:membrane carboxypeptidase/penicillin-binding protein PbpC